MARPKKLHPNEMERTSLYLRSESMRSIKYISFRDERTLKDIIDDALVEYITKWEKKNGPIPR
ncbi:MAG: hypothetical protein WKF97_13900 [Chitinophagaceae bacterium]